MSALTETDEMIDFQEIETVTIDPSPIGEDHTGKDPLAGATGEVQDDWERNGSSYSLEFEELLKKLKMPVTRKSTPITQLTPTKATSTNYSAAFDRNFNSSITGNGQTASGTTYPPGDVIHLKEPINARPQGSPSSPSTKPSFAVSDANHSFEHNYVSLVPEDQIQTWNTQITFTLGPNEQVTTGIQTRLLSFIPTVVAKSRGNILPWDPDSPLNPIRDFHTVCNTDLLPKYFRFQLLTGRRVTGWMRFQVFTNGCTFNHIKHKVPIVQEALRNYPIYWSYSTLETTESVTPIFLVGLSKTTNIKQLKLDLIKHMNLTFPFDISRRMQEARGYKESDVDKSNLTTLKLQVLKVSCAKKDVGALKEKFFSSLGVGVAFEPDMQLSVLPSIKVVTTRKDGPWTEQLLFQALEYQQAFDAASVSLEIHHIDTINTEVDLLGCSRTLQLHLASFLVNNERVVYSVDRTGIDKIWITLKTKYINEYMTYINTIFTEMQGWHHDKVQSVTGSYNRPCWSNDVNTLTRAEQEYFSRENLTNNQKNYPTLPIAKVTRPTRPQAAITPPTKRVKGIEDDVAKHNARPPTITKENTRETPKEMKDLVTLVKTIASELNAIKQEQQAFALLTNQRMQKLMTRADAMDTSLVATSQQFTEQLHKNSEQIRTEVEQYLQAQQTLTDDIYSIKFSSLESSVSAISNMAEDIGKQTQALSKNTNKALDEVGLYIQTNTHTVNTIDQEFQSYRKDTSHILTSIGNKVHSLPTNENLSSFERRIQDIHITQNKMTEQMVTQHDDFTTTLAHCGEIESHQQLVLDRLSYLESQHEGVKSMIAKLRKGNKDKKYASISPTASSPKETYIERRMKFLNRRSTAHDNPQMIFTPPQQSYDLQQLRQDINGAPASQESIDSSIFLTHLHQTSPTTQPPLDNMEPEEAAP